MPVIRYPNTAKALHQINRQMKRPPWTVTFSPRGLKGVRPTVLRGLTEEEARSLSAKLRFEFHTYTHRSRIPGQRRPSDG